MTPKRSILLLLAAALLCAVGSGQTAPQRSEGVPPSNKPKPPAIPRTAVQLALADPLNGPTMLYLWSPTASEADYYAASLVCGVALNQGTCPYQPVRIAGGALIRIDLAQLADNEKQLAKLLHLIREVASINEPFFHYTTATVIAGDKKHDVKTETVVAVSPNVDAAIGVGKIFRADQFAWKCLSTVDDGMYYQFRGLEVGKTKLADYLASRGFDYGRALKNNTLDQTVLVSGVTSQVRIVQLGRSEDVKPSVGTGLVAITKDIKREKNDPNKNGFQSLLNDNQKYFKEVIVNLPTGQQEFTLWDEGDYLLQSADPEVATDTTVPHPFPRTLQCAISCINCHGPNEGLQPMTPEFGLASLGSARIAGDVSKADEFQALAAIRSRYSATPLQLKTALDESTHHLASEYDFLNLGQAHGYQAACQATTQIVNGYENSFVTPDKAAVELGFAAAPGKTIGHAFAAAMPYQNGVVTGSAGILNRLRDGKSVTRAEFDFAYVELEALAMPALDKSVETK